MTGKQIQRLLITCFWLILFGSIAIVQVRAASSSVIQDQLHILSTSQRQRIIRVNQQWQQTRNQPAIWVYTLKQVPSDVSNDPAFGTSDESPITAFQSFKEDVLRKNARYELPAQLDEDRQMAVLHQANRLEKRVSLIIVYPVKNGFRTILLPSDDLAKATSDLQSWRLNRRLPAKSGTGATVMAYFNRYQPFVSKHVATVKKIKPGLSWSEAGFILFLVIVISWLIIHKLRHPHSHLYFDTSGGNSFSEGYFWGWFDNNHFGGSNGGWGPWW